MTQRPDDDLRDGTEPTRPLPTDAGPHDRPDDRLADGLDDGLDDRSDDRSDDGVHGRADHRTTGSGPAPARRRQPVRVGYLVCGVLLLAVSVLWAVGQQMALTDLEGAARLAAGSLVVAGLVGLVGWAWSARREAQERHELARAARDAGGWRDPYAG